MSTRSKIILGIIVALFIAALIWFGKKNKTSIIAYETETPFRTTIVKKTVATGTVTPLEEIEIKPQITGIIDKILLLEGSKVKKGDLIATVRVVPNEQSLISAKGRVDNIKIRLDNAKIQFERSKNLFDKGVVSKQDFENVELAYDQSKQDLMNAQNDYLIIKRGSAGSGGSANTNIMAQMSGTILEIPVKEGDQVIQSNNFNAGTT
ncbi:MAG: HlyD family secretion protein, partial [Polaribacter sp.]